MFKIASNFWECQHQNSCLTIVYKGNYWNTSRNECQYFTQGCLRLIFLTKRESSQKSVNKLSARGDERTWNRFPSTERNFVARPAGILRTFTWCQACWQRRRPDLEIKDWLRGVSTIFRQDDKSRLEHPNRRWTISPGRRVGLMLNSIFQLSGWLGEAAGQAPAWAASTRGHSLSAGGWRPPAALQGRPHPGPWGDERSLTPQSGFWNLSKSSAIIYKIGAHRAEITTRSCFSLCATGKHPPQNWRFP